MTYSKRKLGFNLSFLTNSLGLADVTAAILFHLEGEKLGAPWFLTAGFNHILKTLIDNISKIS